MLLMRVVKSDLMPNAPFFVLFPVARAVPPAAESVTPFVPEYVVTSPTYGNCAKQSGDVPIRPSVYLVDSHSVTDKIKYILGFALSHYDQCHTKDGIK